MGLAAAPNILYLTSERSQPGIDLGDDKGIICSRGFSCDTGRGMEEEFSELYIASTREDVQVVLAHRCSVISRALLFDH